MLAAMGASALACACLAVVPAATLPALSRVTTSVGIGSAPAAHDMPGLRLAGITAAIWPLWTALGLVAVTAAIAVGARRLGRSRRRAIAWDCGGGPLTARMQYTATSFAEPLQRVFDDVLAPERDIDVTHDAESAYHVEAVRYRQRIPDRIENHLYQPVIVALARLGGAGRKLASGSLHQYLAYMLTALILVLVAGVIR
jgi:hypothetical protein